MLHHKAKTTVMIVDDSAVVRQTMVELIAADPRLEVIATATDPYDAVEKLRKRTPDVLLLDIEMPRMDGLTFLRKLMAQHPLPVVVCSSLTEPDSAAWLRAMDYGAVEVIPKLRVGTKRFLEESRLRITDAIHAAASARLDRRPALTRTSQSTNKPARRELGAAAASELVVLIGASTGGVEALHAILEELPSDAPPVLIVQHMPEHFTRSFAHSLDQRCRMEVKEAQHEDLVCTGRALLAQGGRHLMLKRQGSQVRVCVKDGPAVSRHCPSVDVLFRSAAHQLGGRCLGVLLTGMGCDGADGMLELKACGAITIAQDEASSVIFGMPREAIQRGAVDKVLPLRKIAAQILASARRG